MPSTRLPWLEYTGQTTAELLACGKTHRINSLLCAFEHGMQARLEPGNASSLTEEEELVLAVMALNREVNNGGYHQFFVNSSRRFAPAIVASLRRIGCEKAAAITERAIGALQLDELSEEAIAAEIYKENPGRDKILDACDHEYYRLKDMDAKLFRFIEEHEDQIKTAKPLGPLRRIRPRTPGAGGRLWVRLILSKESGRDLDGYRRLARELAQSEGIEVTGAELETAAVLYAFRSSVQAGDVSAGEALAALALEKSSDEPSHSVIHRRWIELLLQSGRSEAADQESLNYLHVLAQRDQSKLGTQNTILFWADLLRGARAELPQSVAFYKANFPEDDLDGPLPDMRMTALPRAPKRV